MENTIAIIGTGPGSRKYITVIALEMIEEAEIIVGATRLLEEFARGDQKQFPVDKNIKNALEFINAQDKDKKMVVLVTGDTGIYSLANYLKKNIKDRKIEFFPGISSLQLMFARLKSRWSDARLLSFHGQPAENADTYIKNGETVGLLTDNLYTPQKIAAYFLDKGIRKETKVAVGRDLSYPQESVFEMTLEELAVFEADFTNSVVIVNYE